jgi:hypothetical protein
MPQVTIPKCQDGGSRFREGNGFGSMEADERHSVLQIAEMCIIATSGGSPIACIPCKFVTWLRATLVSTIR